MRITGKHFFGLLAVAATLASTHRVSAQVIEEPSGSAGTAAYGEAPELNAAAAFAVRPLVFAASTYATGGVGLRNRGAGNISVSGLVGVAKVTFVYWAVISVGAPPAPAHSIQVERFYPLPLAGPVVVPGAIVGVGPTPCWGPANAVVTIFRGVVPPGVAIGNGSYQLTLLPGAQVIVNGLDPWKAFALPTWEGASLVMIGNGATTVAVYDNGLAGKTFQPFPAAFNYTLVLPKPTGATTYWDNIAADGQHVAAASKLAVTAQSDETTHINLIPISGPGSDYVDSDWNGSSALPVAQLWDDTGHDISVAAPPGTVALNVTVNSVLAPADCLVPVANVVQE